MKKFKYLMTINEFFENFLKEEEITALANGTLIALGYKNPNAKRIGKGGGNGDIFPVPDGKILKITKDQSEAINSNNLSKMNDLKRFAKYYKVRRIVHNAQDDISVPIFALLMEKLKPVVDGSEEAININRLKKHFYITQHRKMGEVHDFFNDNLETYEQFIEKNSTERFKELFGTDSNYDTLLKYYNAMNELMKEAIEHKIILGDVTYENFAFNTKNLLVTFDLGGMGNAFTPEGKKASKDERNEMVKNMEVITVEIKKTTASNS